MKKQQKTTVTTWVENEQSTIMSALIYLTRSTESIDGFRSQSRMKLDTEDNEALRYLCRRLNMTPDQVHLLTCVIYHGQSTGHICDIDDVTEYMGEHPLAIYSKRSNFDQLCESGYLEVRESPYGANGWLVRKEVLEALNNNRAFDLEALRSKDNLSFLTECATAIRAGKRNDNNGEIEKQVQWLFKINPHLPITRNIKRMAGGNDLIFKPLLLAAALLGAENVLNIGGEELGMIMRERDVRKVMRDMRRGEHPLAARHFFEPYFQEGGMANADEWVISKGGWMELLDNNMEEVKSFLRDREEFGGLLTSSTTIPERKLFFSGTTQDEVNRLRQLLQDDQYQQIVARLKEKNMPTGLNILLYGTPGTGKTELVQQLARETGRDLYIVDMSEIRDKYVGESEQNLVTTFDCYRSYVARMRKTPILFCNECDALFGTRLERTSGAVDKMENALQNILLEQMEKLQGIMICTTNLTSTLDKAFERRFLLKIQLPKPCKEARKQIWASMLPALSDEQAAELARRFDFSGGQIQNVTRKQVINSVFTGSDEMDFNRLLTDCSAETMDRTNGRHIGFQ